jgi:hypothetical protein
MAQAYLETVKPGELDWKAALLAGLIAGVVFMIMEMTLVALAGMGFWAPPRMIAAMVLGRGVLPPPATFEPGVMMVAMAIHFVLSIAYALIFAWIVSRWILHTYMVIIAGTVFGLGLYVINFYGFTVLFPWFAEARNWISIVSHLAFGAVLAFGYWGLAERTAERD